LNCISRQLYFSIPNYRIGVLVFFDAWITARSARLSELQFHERLGMRAICLVQHGPPRLTGATTTQRLEARVRPLPSAVRAGYRLTNGTNRKT